jgi:flagellar hook-associated protein 3 FlgL
MIYNQLLASIQSGQTNLSGLTRQLATQKKILAPSDDVMGTVRALDYEVNISSNNQYKTNITNVTNSLNQANTALTSFSGMLSTVKGILINATSNIDPGIEQATAGQVAQLRDQLLGIANTKIGSTYLFAGFEANLQPYAAGTYAYQGDNGITNVPIGKGAAMASNVPGSSAFSYTPAAYNMQISGGLNVHYTAGAGTTVNVEIRDATDTTILQNFSFSNAVQLTDLLSTAIANNDTQRIEALVYPFSKIQDQINSVQADVGARLGALKDQSTLLDQNTNTLQDSLSKIQDADTAKIGVQLQQADTALQALYSTSAKIIPQSLFDFLK